jgi:hypothetical protein
MVKALIQASRIENLRLVRSNHRGIQERKPLKYWTSEKTKILGIVISALNERARSKVIPHQKAMW